MISKHLQIYLNYNRNHYKNLYIIDYHHICTIYVKDYITSYCPLMKQFTSWLSSPSKIHFNVNLSPEVRSNADLHSPSRIHSNMNLFPKIHSNMSLHSPFKIHSNINLSIKIHSNVNLHSSSEIHSNMNPFSLILQRIPHSLKHNSNGKIKFKAEQEYSNINLSFIFSFLNSLPSSSANILHADDIAKLLKQYLNHCFIDIIISIMISDIWVDFEERNFGQIRRPNHASIFAYPDIITNFIQSEILKRCIKEINNLPANYFCSSINLISILSDDKQIKWKTIFNLFFPNDYSINNNISKEYDSLIYEILENAIQLIIQIEKKMMMMK